MSLFQGVAAALNCKCHFYTIFYASLNCKQYWFLPHLSGGATMRSTGFFAHPKLVLLSRHIEFCVASLESF